VVDGPATEADGRTYTFHVRPGLRFSPPSGQAVTAAAFARAITRSLDPRMRSFARVFMTDVRGVHANGNTLTVTLAAPAPSLPARLATSYFCAVPPTTPISAKGIDALPSAGPYYVASHVAGKSIILRRNPGYQGPRPRRFAEIRYTIGVPVRQAIAEVDAGRADYVSDVGPFSNTDFGDTTALAQRLGPTSDAARAGRQQYYATTGLALSFYALNPTRPLFADARMRRAISYALDRRALAQAPGFPGEVRPADQLIPPGEPAYQDIHAYPLGGPDVQRARRLAGTGPRRAVLYTCNLPGCAVNTEVLRRNLAAIGVALEVRRFPIPVLITRMARRDEPYDLGLETYLADYADPFNSINLQHAPGGVNPVPIRAPRLRRRMAAAARLSGPARLAAYARLDRDLTRDAAPFAVFGSRVSVHLFSARIGCQFQHPVYGISLGALCVRSRARG
jgi:peptide/nickel transport system substrate-binding protein